MSATDQQLSYLRDVVMPRMAEGGMEAFVIAGYMRTPDGALQRVCFANTAKNPAFEDALRPLIHYAHMWGATVPQGGPQTPPPPPQEGHG